MPTPDAGPGRGPVGIQTNEAVTPQPLKPDVARVAPPIPIPQGRRRESPWLRRIALGTGGVLLATGGALALRSFTQGPDGPAGPVATDTPRPTGTPEPTITITPIPSPEPTPSATPTETPVPPTPTATPTETPIPTPTAEVLFPNDPILQDWVDRKLNPPQKWLDGRNRPEPFGLVPSVENTPREAYYQTVLLTAKKIGDNNIILFMGMEDKNLNRYVVAFDASQIPFQLDSTDKLVAVHGPEFVDRMYPNDFYEMVQDGTYENAILWFSLESGNEGDGRVLFEVANTALNEEVEPLLSRPDVSRFINNPNATSGPPLSRIVVYQP